MPVKQVAKLEEFTQIIGADNLTLVDFFATWCGPCKAVAPKIEELSNKYTNVTFLKVDVDEATAIAEKEEITVMPTFKLYKGGAKVDQVVGASAEKVENAIKANQ